MKLHETRLLVSRGSGAKVAWEFTRRFREGSNTIELPDVGTDTDSSDIDIISHVHGVSLYLESAQVRPVAEPSQGIPAGRTEAKLAIHSDSNEELRFTVLAGVAVDAAVRHCLVVTPQRPARFSSRLTIVNNRAIPIQDAYLTLTEGEARSDNPPGEPAHAGQPCPVCYRFDFPNKLTLGANERVAVNLFGRDFLINELGRELRLEGMGNYLTRDERLLPGGAIETRYRIANTEANGLGVVLPRGELEILQGDGTMLARSSVADTDTGEQLELSGGPAHDLEVRRQQTSFQTNKAGAAQESMIEVGQRIDIRNRKQLDERVVVIEQLPGSPGSVETAVSEVRINGSLADEASWTFNPTQLQLEIHNLLARAEGHTEVRFKVRYSANKSAPERDAE